MTGTHRRSLGLAACACLAAASLLAACAATPGQHRRDPLPEPPELVASLQGSSWTSLDGWRIHYYDWGPADAATIVVFIHGWAANGFEAWPVSEQLAPAGGTVRLIAVDLPGCGFSERPATSLGMDGYVRFVSDWLDLVETALAPGAGRQRVLWAHSLGGHMALRSLWDGRFKPGAAGGAPGLTHITRLVLSAPNGLKGEEGAAGAIRNGELLRFLSPLYTDALYDQLAAAQVFADMPHSPQLVHQVGKLALKWDGGLDALADITGDTLASQPVDAILADIKLPVLLTWGSVDKVLDPRYAPVYHAGLPDNRLVWLPGGGHGAHIEQAATLAGLIRDFIAARPAKD